MATSLRERWDRDGYVVLSQFYSAEELIPAETCQREAWSSGAPRVGVDDLMTGKRLRMAEVYWMHRAHQPTSGAAVGETPPLPDAIAA